MDDNTMAVLIIATLCLFAGYIIWIATHSKEEDDE